MGITQAEFEAQLPAHPSLKIVSSAPSSRKQPIVSSASSSRKQRTIWARMFNRLKRAPEAREEPAVSEEKEILAITVEMKGALGGKNRHLITYNLLADISSIRDSMPTVWVTHPADFKIRHVNIWKASHLYCHVQQRHLPSLCWQSYADAWRRAPASARTLGCFLEYLLQFLNEENENSPAR